MHGKTITRQHQRGTINRRRLLALSGAAFSGLGLLACGGQQKSSGQAQPEVGRTGAQTTEEKPVPGGTLTAFITYNAPLDPQKVSAGAQTVVGGVYSRVFRFVTGPNPNTIADHDLENDLGASVESPDATTWVVKLRPNASFHNVAPVNGHPVEAEDIKATFTRALDPATASPNRGALSMIDAGQIETPDKQTVVFKLNYPYAPFRKTLASPAYSLILPREVLTGAYDPAKQAIGSGPFILESFTPDVAYVYKKNAAWFEPGRPYVDSVRLAVVPDPAQQLAQFTAGNSDEFYPDVNDLASAQGRNPKATLVTSPDGRPFPIYFQLGEPDGPFMDIRLRRAVSMAIDRDAIARSLFGGRPQTTLFVPAYMGKWAIKSEDLDPGIAQFFKYNPAEAKKLAEAAGAANLPPIKFAYVVNGGFTSPIYVQHAETTASMMNAIGIKTVLVPHDYNKDFVGGGKGSRQGYFEKDMVVFGSTASYTEADEFLFSYFHSKSLSNGEHLKDPMLDGMIDKQRTIVNEDERLKAIKDIEKYIAEKMYVVPTVGAYRYTLVQPRVQNYDYSDSLGRHTETFAKLWLKG
jgi:peptide/nickel transport system substrate-binding protein